MTDRIRTLTVVLDADYRDDDAAAILAAIQMVRGVASVLPRVVEGGDHIARFVAKQDMRAEVAGFLKRLYELG